MTINMATSILRLLAVLVVILGGILFSPVLCQIHTVNGATYKPLVSAYYFPVVVSLAGAILFLLSSILGKLIATEKG